jgi:toxin ParE1/3/4
MQIKWLNKALDNLDEAYDYLHQENPAVAQAFVQEVYRATQLLLDNPAQGRPGRVPGTRELILQRYPYLIPYRVVDNQIQVLRVFHTRQQPPSSW